MPPRGLCALILKDEAEHEAVCFDVTALPFPFATILPEGLSGILKQGKFITRISHIAF